MDKWRGEETAIRTFAPAADVRLRVKRFAGGTLRLITEKFRTWVIGGNVELVHERSLLTNIMIYCDPDDQFLDAAVLRRAASSVAHGERREDAVPTAIAVSQSCHSST
jgi:hypothetical protein